MMNLASFKSVYLLKLVSRGGVRMNAIQAVAVVLTGWRVFSLTLILWVQVTSVGVQVFWR